VVLLEVCLLRFDPFAEALSMRFLDHLEALSLRSVWFDHLGSFLFRGVV
jgi:hypothetical protein